MFTRSPQLLVSSPHPISQLIHLQSFPLPVLLWAFFQCSLAILPHSRVVQQLARCEIARKFNCYSLGRGSYFKPDRWPFQVKEEESQNVQGWKGPLWVTQSNPLPKQGHLQQAAQDLVQAGLEYLQRRLHSLPGQPVPVLRHPQSEEVLPHVQVELPKLQFVPISPCPVTGHHWKESGRGGGHQPSVVLKVISAQSKFILKLVTETQRSPT